MCILDFLVFLNVSSLAENRHQKGSLRQNFQRGIHFHLWNGKKTKPFINVGHEFIKYLLMKEQKFNNTFIRALPVLFNNNIYYTNNNYYHCSTNLKTVVKRLFQYYCHFCVILYYFLLFRWYCVENIHFWNSCESLGKEIKKSI